MFEAPGVKNSINRGTACDFPSLTAQIRHEAGRLGFFRSGIVAAGPLPHGESFESWLQSGMHGGMEYMERQAPKRKNPRLVLEDVRSILVLAMNYYPGKLEFRHEASGRISRYALGDDYHALMLGRLRQLQEFIERTAPGMRCLCYVDTGPIMEKVWGAMSSIGWMGKHSNLITRGHGSWFFIGVILLDLVLEFDGPTRDYCGRCTRCITGCPTGAIVAPYVVDARLCISYLTIEHKGAIPRALRPLIGDRIYGCDDCQEVCPWNRFAIESSEEHFRPQPDRLSPALDALSCLSPEEFSAHFKASPIRRLGRDGFVRNVVVALGNTRDPRSIAALAHALRDSSSLVRAHAAWSIGQIPDVRARQMLLAARVDEADPRVQEEIAAALG